MSALQDSNDTPFTPSFDAIMRHIARYTHNHPVAVHGHSDVLRGDENVRFARCFRRKKPVAGLINRQLASYEVRLGRKNIAVLANTRDFARALELTQGFPQCNAFAGGEAKLASDIDVVKRPVIFSRQKRQNLFSNLTSVYSHLGETIGSSLST